MPAGSLLFLVTLTFAPCEAQGLQSGGTTETRSRIDFTTKIRPILNKHCTACHGGVKRVNGVSFLVRDRATRPAKSGRVPIRPGDPAGSELMRRVTSLGEDRMPPPEHAPQLSDEEIALLGKWIEQGAEWTEHWAYVKPAAVAIPDVSDPGWCMQPADRFVLARLDAEGQRPSRPADRIAWLRRVSFDLVGLPPTPDDIAAFLDDCTESAFDGAVDKLLASPAFGERWATLWLDLARYSDTMGYEKDPPRIVWPYRDWVIRAFNVDMPFDAFTIRQLAGDLLPDATLDDELATSFHRQTQTNTEGGTDDEEFRIAAVIDRVNTTWEVWQATTFRCAQCHAHPYEPIEHEEFYRSMALFDSSQDCDLDEEFPLLRVAKSEPDRERAYQIGCRIRRLRRSVNASGLALADKRSLWQSLCPDKAESTGLAELEIRRTDAVPELLAGGTISEKSRFTLEFPLPADVTRLAALRIDVLPMDIETAASSSELGFVLSRLKLSVTTAASEPDSQTVREVALVAAFDDDPDSFFPAKDSLQDNPRGWGAYTRLNRPRYAVFVPEQAVDLATGDRLQLVLTQDMMSVGAFPLAIRRARFWVSESDEWQRLLRDEEFVAQTRELAELEKARDEIPSVAVPVLAERGELHHRVTRVFIRGNWLDRGEQVSAGVPRLFPPLPESGPADRLALARWLVSPDNPLTARVAVNRFWEQLFGRGIVETLEDLGSSGTAPTHPELLDFLALHFQNDLGWSVKRLLRELVLSATYRQHSGIAPGEIDRDPGNRLLARGPRVRLSAEMVRDQALAVSGLLTTKRYGPPVMPPQPDGIWRSVYNIAKWQTSSGEDRYRRGVYTYCKRTSGYPSFLMFDMPSREVCAARRVRTNTPLQALIVLNDPVYMECAVALANRMQAEGGDQLESQIAHGYLLATGRSPQPDALRELVDLASNAAQRYAGDPELSSQLGDSPRKAALAVVANAILNLDVVLTK
jgi:Protein of unknown function (DUF1553)/Protein of unknown function (DUF1549)/Planctomycete cytochrome C